MKMKVSTSRGRLIVLGFAICGTGILCIGSFLLIYFENIVQFFMKKELVLKPGNEFYNIWKEIPLPIYQKIYVFNITNPTEYEHNGEKPILQELGPYVFRGRWYKENMVWNDTDGTITYKDNKDYTFVPELSVGDQEEMVYALNGPLLAVINYVEDYRLPYFLRTFAVEMMNGIFESYNESLLIHKTVRELVYEGYHEPMVSDLTKVIEQFVTLPLKLVNDTFGILHERAHVGDGTFTIKSGLQGLDDYAAIQKWNNQSSVNWWNDKVCDQVVGTDGVQYAPNVRRNQTLSLFNPNLCRSMPLEYERDITVHGIKTFRFTMPADTFATGDVNPDNKCFCQGPKCRSGILPMNCKKGAPFVLSMPHFLEGDESLLAELEGVQPPNQNHQTYVDVEPVTGFVLNAAFRMQLNGVVRRLPEYKALENVVESIVPVIWMSEEAQLDVFFANYFKSRVQTPLVMFKVASLTAVVLGTFWTLASVVFIFCLKTKVQPDNLKHSFVLKTLNSVYTSVALWPPNEEENHVSEKTHL